MLINKSKGITPSERFLANLAEKTFLNLWSYPNVFKEQKGEEAIIAANVDLYSGFVYRMLDIPTEIFTPLFAIARMGGWCAHRIEQILSDVKIIRPAYRSVAEKVEYIPLEKR